MFPESYYNILKRFILKHEGGWFPEEVTMKGVTLSTYRRLINQEATAFDLKEMTDAEWDQVFRSFWDAVLASQMVDQKVAISLVDYFWMSGRPAVKALQSLLDVEEDGIVGRDTLAAIGKHRGEGLDIELCQVRLARYRRLKNWSRYGKGWTSRIEALITLLSNLR